MFFVSDVDTRDLESSWRDALDELSRGMVTAVRNATTEGAAEARTVHTYKDQTGALTKSIKGALTESGRGYAEGYIRAGDKKASWIEDGTAPHRILPKAGEGIGPLRQGQSRRSSKDIGTHRTALRWRGADGVTHFARVVNHPGGKSYPFMGPAALKAERVLVRDMEISIERVRKIMEE